VGLRQKHGHDRVNLHPPLLANIRSQWHYVYIHDEVLPYLRDHGVTEARIDAMPVAVPRRDFSATTRS
jgi:phosphotriesterase-related protein